MTILPLLGVLILSASPAQAAHNVSTNGFGISDAIQQDLKYCESSSRARRACELSAETGVYSGSLAILCKLRSNNLITEAFLQGYFRAMSKEDDPQTKALLDLSIGYTRAKFPNCFK
jgi:hypothetical protein